MAGASLGSRFQVGPWTVCADECRIRSATRDAHLRPLLMDLLVLLASRAGAVVTKDEIFDRVWQRQFVTESALTRSIAELRASLGDTLKPPHYIETVSKRGYRLLAPVVACQERSRPRVAVLPFENLGHGPDEDSLADGLVDTLIAALGRRPELRVISRQSVLHLKRAQAAIAEIARELGVDALVTGTILRAGTRLRVSVQLVQVAPEQQLWADHYDSGADDVLELQDRLAERVVHAVSGALTPAPPAVSADRAATRAARMAYSEARLSSESMTPAALASSVEQLHGVIKTDPFFAPAYHDLAVNLVTMGFWGHLPPARAYSDAEEAASLGLALDDSLSEGHVALAYVRWLNDWDSAAAEREFRHAVSLNPSSASAHLSYALFLAAVRRNSTHAIQQVTATLRMDPLSPMTAALCGWIFLFVGDLDGASRQAMRALALHPDALHAHYVLGWVAGRRDDWPGAVEHFEEALAVSRESHSLAYLGHALARGGRRDDAVALLNELKTRRQHERVSPYCFAVWHAGAGETDEAFAYLEQCYEHRESRIFWLPVTPASDLLRGDPRFDAFLERLGVAVPD